MCVSKVQHMTGRKTGCNLSRPVSFGFLIFQQMSQLATEKIQNLCNRNRWSGLLQLGSVQFRSFFQSRKLDLRTLATSPSGNIAPSSGVKYEVRGWAVGTNYSPRLKTMNKEIVCHLVPCHYQ